MNKLNHTITGAFFYEFERRCLVLLVDSYKNAKSNCHIDIECEEERISALLFNYIDNSLQAAEWHIDISNEFRYYDRKILRGKKAAKSAPRIDFRLATWENSRKLSYFAEAKNLIETDVLKKGRKSKISASFLFKRYITTGVDNYVSGRYPLNGCLIGYVLQGIPKNIINRINNYLQNANRDAEVLSQQFFGLPDFDASYISMHKNDLVLKHLIFDFTSNC